MVPLVFGVISIITGGIAAAAKLTAEKDQRDIDKMIRNQQKQQLLQNQQNYFNKR